VQSRTEPSFVRPASIPCNPDEAAASTDAAPSIAIVTDDWGLAEACATVLSGEGYRVQIASHSGHAVLALLAGQRLDVLIAELSMEEGSGPSLMRRMRRYNHNLRALFLARTGTSYDADNVLMRPFTREDLLCRVRRLLGDGQ
jgi:DNA-binding response OmpR family regulator